MTSVELNRALGAFVLEKVAARVDLREPELEIHVEVMPSETFVYMDRMPGPGGLPVGASGTVAAPLPGGPHIPGGRLLVDSSSHPAAVAPLRTQTLLTTARPPP